MTQRSFGVIILAISLFPFRGLAQVSPTATHTHKKQCALAVLDLKAGKGFTDKGALALTDVVSEQVAKHSSCSVLSRDEIRSLLSFEAEQQLLGCNDDSCMADLGNALGVDFLVVGSISKVGESTLVSLKQIDLATIKVQRRLTDTSAGTDDEIVQFIAWMARRLAAGDKLAGPKPKVVKRIKKVQMVEKHTTVWRNMAWTGLALTGAVAVVTGIAAGTTYGLSEYVNQNKQSNDVNTDAIGYADKYGPGIATLANVGLYISLALAVPTVVLFFFPAEEIVEHEVDSKRIKGAKNAPSASEKNADSSAQGEGK